ncbi:flagellar hook-length control protein FliK [Pelomonas sp. SE-A7]|uniref:flagellar hook-length control protein FliK n=1 Tax=Pelomonas sp. SE-A7 TaxID=3054953 RepID=UPI00259CF179|nr:flagellar hook-length control protein FliK [Pelomonas sp. SE-A7]MDM4764494.1 flagellar hook-length control protein FliK [Pelomonas sp. SE-A7]
MSSSTPNTTAGGRASQALLPTLGLGNGPARTAGSEAGAFSDLLRDQITTPPPAPAPTPRTADQPAPKSAQPSAEKPSEKPGEPMADKPSARPADKAAAPATRNPADQGASGPATESADAGDAAVASEEAAIPTQGRLDPRKRLAMQARLEPGQAGTAESPKLKATAALASKLETLDDGSASACRTAEPAEPATATEELDPSVAQVILQMLNAPLASTPKAGKASQATPERPEDEVEVRPAAGSLPLPAGLPVAQQAAPQPLADEPAGPTQVAPLVPQAGKNLQAFVPLQPADMELPAPMPARHATVDDEPMPVSLLQPSPTFKQVVAVAGAAPIERPVKATAEVAAPPSVSTAAPVAMAADAPPMSAPGAPVAGFAQQLQSLAASPGTEAAQPAHAKLALPQRLHSIEFAPAMSARLAVLAADGIQQAQLQLNPAEMGPVSVQIVVDGQQAQIAFHASQAETRQVLEQSLPELAAALREQGLTLSGGGVFEQSQQQARQQAGADDGVNQGSWMRVGDEGDAALPGSPTSRPASTGGGRGMLDLYA